MFSACMNEQGFCMQDSSCLENRFPCAYLSCTIDAVICEAVNILLCMRILFFICFVMQNEPRVYRNALPDV